MYHVLAHFACIRPPRMWVARTLHAILILSMILPGLATVPVKAAPKGQEPEPESRLQITPVLSDTSEAELLETITATITDTQSGLTPTITVTTVPTATVTPVGTELPTLEPTPTASVTPIPTPATPSVTATATLTATLPVTTSTVVQTEPIKDVTLEASQTWVAPGDSITLTWKLEGVDDWTSDDFSGVELNLSLPSGFIPQGVEAADFDPISSTLRTEIADVKGNIALKVEEDAKWPYVLTGRIIQTEKSEAVYSLELKGRWPTQIDLKGGEATGFNGKVKVGFPPEALAEALTVEIREPDDIDPAPYYPDNFPFEIVALSQKDGLDVDKFTQPITIQLEYDPSQISGDENNLAFFYYDKELNTWVPLPSHVDQATHTLTGSSDHLTEIDIDVQTWESARLPSLSNFQVAQFTGAATYSFPLQLPPGPGGLQPSLELSYNSQVADAASARSQASWVGMGWSLEGNTIQRDQHDTPDYYDDDTFTLQIGGVSGLLLPIADQDTDPNTDDFRLQDDNFWRIRHYKATGTVDGRNGDMSSWIVWNKTGSQYYFEERAHYIAIPGACSTIFMQTWQWSLSRVRNIFNKEMTYSYTPETGTKTAKGCTAYPTNMTLAVYPHTITYANNRYQVHFETLGRTDYDTAWNNSASTTFYMRSRLSEVQVKHDANGDGTFEQLIRKYQLDFGENGQQIFPNRTWSATGKALTLTSIREYGLNGAGPLPATTFYYDTMHLIRAENGYGGQVYFFYEAEDLPWREIDSHADAAKDWSNDIKTCTGGGSEDNLNAGTAAPIFNPGQVYTITLTATTHSELPRTIEDLGVHDGVNSILAQDLRVSWTRSEQQSDDLYNYHYTATGTVRLPPNASQAQFFYRCSPSGKSFSDIHYVARPFVTRYRVVRKQISDDVTQSSYDFNYSYDGPATNDANHSQAVTDTTKEHRYTPAYTEYRGNAMVREEGPDGRVTTLFYHQDDTKRGQANTTITAAQDYQQPFDSTNWNDYSSQWSWGGAQPTFERLDGDVAVKITDSDAGWNTLLTRSAATLSDGETAVMQFRLKLNGSQNALLGLYSGNIGNDYQRFGVYADLDGSLRAEMCHTHGSGTHCHYETVLLSTDDFKLDAWHVLMLTVDDDDQFLLQVWPREKPSLARQFTYDMASGRTWKFGEWVNYGVLYLDEYSEGRIFIQSYNVYDADSDAPIGPDSNLLPKDEDTQQAFSELMIYWTRPLSETTMTFEGDATWAGKRTAYEYHPSDQGGTQFGNLSRQIEAQWNGAAWVYYRATRTWYFPNTTDPTRYLAGLPGATNRYRCPGGNCEGYSPADALGSRIYLYDGSTSWTSPPITGMLTGERSLICYANDSNQCFAGYDSGYTRLLYNDQLYEYDEWGNRTKVKQYSGYGRYERYTGLNVLASSGLRETTYCYGNKEPSGGYCQDDAYHTYLGWEKGALTTPVHITKYEYLFEFGQPWRITDPNGAVTTMSYDNFGRMTNIRRPGDESGQATLAFAYYDTAFPFYTQATQKIDGSVSYTLRKYYDGLGNLIQSQVVGASISGQPLSRDILVDSWFDAFGQVTRQSMPYDVATGETYHTRDESKPATYTSYDIMGRTSSITAPDGTYTARYTYRDLETRVMDANGNTTRNKRDVWGRTTQVIPLNGDNDANPINPSVTYGYNEADNLVTATYGAAVTTLYYDLAGRKTQMVDPDMGTWYYSYDALGNLTRQTDARGQRICLYYDVLNRLLGKHNRTDDACPGSPTYNVSYTYDQGTNGIGRRTYMSDPSGSTTWSYDARGRVTQEIKAISGSGTFKTLYGYNSADLVNTINYPLNNSSGTGELVKFKYLPQKLLEFVCTWNGSSCTYSYSPKMQYDAAGRVRLRKLGGTDAAPVLQSAYDYFDWQDLNGVGRLRYLQTGTPGNPTSLQDFRYYTGTDTSSYDAVGNVLRIEDWKAGGTQTQTFHYDNLNRLIDATASGGTGGTYPFEQYQYSATSGNLSSKAGVSLGYAAQSANCPAGALSKAHAVTTAGSNTYCYDQNGNMVRRTLGGSEYNLTYDAENHLTAVSGPGVNASFVYDGDGNRVKGTVGPVITAYVGNYFEWTGSTSTMVKYYYAGTTRVAMRTGTGSGTTGLLWLLGDHLGSTAKVANVDGTPYANGEQRYKPWGEKRYPSGASGLPTSYRFTGERQESGLGPSGGEGLYWVGSRWLDPALGRWIQADSVIPSAEIPLDWDRYAYTRNNPLKFVDPSGHRPCDDEDTNGNCKSEKGWIKPKKPWRSPLDDMSTSGFAFDRKNHPGQDYDGPAGSLIYASGTGTVIISDPCTATDCYNKNRADYQFYAPFNEGYGNVAVIEYLYYNLPQSVINKNAMQPGDSLYFLYAHLREPSTLSAGTTVQSGDIVGNVGSTGFSDGEHLHLEVRLGVSGSLEQGDMCLTTCFSNQYNPSPRFHDWYDSGDYDPLNPTTVNYSGY